MESEGYQCRQCYERSEEGGACERCGAKEKVELGDEGAREAWVEELCERAIKSRDRKVKWMRLGVVVLAALFWGSGLWVVSGMGVSPVALSWGVKMMSVVLLGVGWWAAPQIYHRHMEGEAGRSLRRLEDT